jgi:tRNA(adenine34) deaminase
MSNPVFIEAMRKSLELAAKASKQGDVPVGAVVLNPAGEIVGQGFNTREIDNDPMNHAEIVAMREAAIANNSWRLDDHTLVVTLEPCTMCAGAAVQARIGRIVFGAFDDKAGIVSERPKVQLSKSCVRASAPWVQIPPIPPRKKP